MARIDSLIGGLGVGLDRVLDWAGGAAWRGYLLVSLIAIAVALPGFVTLPVTDRDEARFVQATKQMMQSGDYIDIRFQDEPRWKKPVGIYWLQAATALPAGGPEAPIWAYRLPSMLAAILAALATVWAGRAILGARASVLGGMLMATTLLLAAEATIAKTDASLTLTAVLVMAVLFRLMTGQTGRYDWIVFWLAIAGSILLKGPIVPVIALLAIAAAWIARRSAPPLAALRPIPGLVLTAALVGPWLVAIWQVSDGAFFQEAVGRDLLGKVAEGQEKHWGPPGLYAAIVWATFWPAAGLLLPALASAWAARRDSAVVLMIAAWVLPFWIVLEVVQTKLPHYVLPLYPALALLVAWQATENPAAEARWIRIASTVVTALSGVVLGLAAMALPLILEGRLVIGAALLGLIAAALALVAARAALKGRQSAQMAGSGLSAIAAVAAVLHFGLPALDTAFGTPRIAVMAAHFDACRAGPIVSAGYREPSLVFATDAATMMPSTETMLGVLMAEPGTVVLLEERRRERLAQLTAAMATPPSLVEHASVSFFNYNRGNRETVTLITRDDPRFEPCAEALHAARQ